MKAKTRGKGKAHKPLPVAKLPPIIHGSDEYIDAQDTAEDLARKTVHTALPLLLATRLGITEGRAAKLIDDAFKDPGDRLSCQVWYGLVDVYRRAYRLSKHEE